MITVLVTLGLLVIFCLVIYLAIKSPFFESLCSLVVLLFWGLFLPVCVAFISIVKFIPEHQYIRTILSFLLVAAIQVPWFAIGAPAIKSLFKTKGNWTLWT